MHATFDAILLSWPFDPWLLFVILVTDAVYWRGWFLLRRRGLVAWHAGRLGERFLGAPSPFILAAWLLLWRHSRFSSCKFT